MFTENINDSLVIERDNIVIIGQGHILQGSGDGTGITLVGRTNVTVQNITVQNFSYGIRLDASSDITVSNNTIEDNTSDGIYIVYSDFSTFYGNTIALNNRYGIELSSSGNNKFFHNNFIENTDDNVYVFDSFNNIWDNDYPSGGNYWSDYEARYPNATELDDSGMWNTTYIIDSYNMDRYPLMLPWVIPEFSAPALVLYLSILSILAVKLANKRKKSTI
jgi:parallel beta-helix repeat protein